MSLTLPQTRVPDPADAPSLRWGIIAPGRIARSFAGSVLKHSNQRVVACASSSKQRAEAFAAEFELDRNYDSYEQLASDPEVDAIYVASTHNAHAEQALLAIEGGKHVLVEKAFTQNAEQARAVIQAARSKGVALMEAMWTRFLPRTDIVRQLLADGALGEVETVSADHGQYFDFDPSSRLFNPGAAGGALLDLGIYPVSYSFFVLGAPSHVRCIGSLTETGVDRQASILLDGYAEHPHAQALLNTTLAAKTPTVAAISGSVARVELPDTFYTPGIVRLVGRDGDVVESDPPAIRGHEGLCHQAAHLAQLVSDGRTESDWLSLDETLAIMEVMDELRAQVGVVYPDEG